MGLYTCILVCILVNLKPNLNTKILEPLLSRGSMRGWEPAITSEFARGIVHVRMALRDDLLSIDAFTTRFEGERFYAPWDDSLLGYLRYVVPMSPSKRRPQKFFCQILAS